MVNEGAGFVAIDRGPALLAALNLASGEIVYRIRERRRERLEFNEPLPSAFTIDR